jgi:hypothetical protein
VRRTPLAHLPRQLHKVRLRVSRLTQCRRATMGGVEHSANTEMDRALFGKRWDGPGLRAGVERMRRTRESQGQISPWRRCAAQLALISPDSFTKSALHVP